MSATTAGRKPRRVGSALKWVGIFVLGVVVFLAVAAWIASIVLRPTPPSPASITRKMRAQAALTGGAKVYATTCVFCHDSGIGPPIAHLGLSADAVRIFVRHGPGAMPSFTPAQLSDADIAAVASYIDALPPRQAAAS